MNDPTTHELTDFADLGLRPELVSALAELGYEEPTPIQRAAVPPLLEGRDLLGQAATGTGKTAAFALPLLQRLADGERGPAPAALVVVPTRELAVQVSEAVHRYGRSLGARTLPLYGGQPIHRQLAVLRRGVDVVVATPGRALDHLGRGSLSFASLEVVVLDEADEMLDMGFAEDLDAILAATPEDRQTMLFSATLPPRIDGIARRHLRDPVHITITAPTREGATPLVRETAYVVRRAHKPAALGRILDMESPDAALVFCRTRTVVDDLTETLGASGYRAEALHGGMGQEQRERVLGRLRAGAAELLIATDVAARGLDVDTLTHVINYDVPASPEAYVHRVGRVGRAGREGAAITFVSPREHRLLPSIEAVTKRPIAVEKLPSVADLRARRLALTEATVREAIVGDGIDAVRAVVDSLSDEFDLMEVALGAVKLVHDAAADATGEEEIPDASPDRRGEHPRPAGRGPRDQGRRRRSEGTARLFIGAGRQLGIRPGDLVGAIANEAGVPGRDIGAIQVAERHAIVEVPAPDAERVIEALRGTTIKGRRVNVRRDRDRG